MDTKRHKLESEDDRDTTEEVLRIGAEVARHPRPSMSTRCNPIKPPWEWFTVA